MRMLNEYAEQINKSVMRGIFNLLQEWERDGELDDYDKKIIEYDIITLPEDKQRVIKKYIRNFIPQNDLEL